MLLSIVAHWLDGTPFYTLSIWTETVIEGPLFLWVLLVLGLKKGAKVYRKWAFGILEDRTSSA